MARRLLVVDGDDDGPPSFSPAAAARRPGAGHSAGAAPPSRRRVGLFDDGDGDDDDVSSGTRGGAGLLKGDRAAPAGAASAGVDPNPFSFRTFQNQQQQPQAWNPAPPVASSSVAAVLQLPELDDDRPGHVPTAGGRKAADGEDDREPNPFSFFRGAAPPAASAGSSSGASVVVASLPDLTSPEVARRGHSSAAMAPATAAAVAGTAATAAGSDSPSASVVELQEQLRRREAELARQRQREADEAQQLQEFVAGIERKLAQTVERAERAEARVAVLEAQLAAVPPDALRVQREYDDRAEYCGRLLVKAADDAAANVRGLLAGVETLKQIEAMLASLRMPKVG